MEGRLDQVRKGREGMGKGEGVGEGGKDGWEWEERVFSALSLQSIDSSSLPPATRQKLHSIFGLIEKEFEVRPLMMI